MNGNRNTPDIKNSNSFKISNVAGQNTFVKFINPQSTISADISSVKLASMIKPSNGRISIEGLNVTGGNVDITGNPLNISARSFHINDHKPSYVSGLNISEIEEGDSLTVKVAKLSFSPELNDIFNEYIHVNDVTIELPVIRSVKQRNADTTQSSVKNKRKKGRITINRVVMNDPDIKI